MVTKEKDIIGGDSEPLNVSRLLVCQRLPSDRSVYKSPTMETSLLNYGRTCDPLVEDNVNPNSSVPLIALSKAESCTDLSPLLNSDNNDSSSSYFSSKLGQTSLSMESQTTGLSHSGDQEMMQNSLHETPAQSFRRNRPANIDLSKANSKNSTTSDHSDNDTITPLSAKSFSTLLRNPMSFDSEAFLPTLQGKLNTHKFRSPSLPLNSLSRPLEIPSNITNLSAYKLSLLLDDGQIKAIDELVKEGRTNSRGDSEMGAKNIHNLEQTDCLIKLPFIDGSTRINMPKSGSREHSNDSLDISAEDPLSNDGVNTSLTPMSLSPTSPLHSSHSLQLYDETYTTKNNKTLVVDVRPFTQYMTSRIKTAVNICIPSTLLKRPTFGLSRFSECMIQEQRQLMDDIEGYDFAVLYDGSTEEIGIGAYSPLLYTLIKFAKALVSDTCKTRVCYLNGGFSKFCSQYPHLVEKTPHLTFDITSGHRRDESFGSVKSFNSFGRAGSLDSNSLVTGGSVIEVSDSSSQASSVSSYASSIPLSLAPVLTGFSLPIANIRSENFMVSSLGNFQYHHYVKEDINIKLPESLGANEVQNSFPPWLQNIIDGDSGRLIVAERFNDIQLAERARVDGAYSVQRAFDDTDGHEHDSYSHSYSHSVIEDNIIYSVSAAVEKGAKNRYHNIYPYDHTRVRLSSFNNSSDYFNASYIFSKESSRRYIATQGPMPDTFDDFWKVIFDENIPVIVMLTPEFEGGHIKCHRYWENGLYGQFRLEQTDENEVMLSRKTRTLVTVRTFSLKSMIEPTIDHTVVQLHYTSWPDLGIPASPDDLLALCSIKNDLVSSWVRDHEQIRSQQTEPMVLVHCSAGCGRTGTFCAIDSVTEMLENGKATGSSDVVFDVVHDFRRQRVLMVQSISQFILCYEAVILWIHNKNNDSAKVGPD